ncbi:MAG: hypothetical protein RIS43_1045 [Actinomycetota bacterium]|jgi:peptidoglycan/LPS O-acetylase OafA/YrhL
MPFRQRVAQPHVAALDGVRAIAIVAVVLFHMGANWLPGGYLGVDVFFVLSGYLITWILLDRLRRLGRVNFKEFYLARARRLLPALLFLVFGVAIGVALWAPDTIRRFLSDLPFALTGTTNWRFIAENQDYFTNIGRPSLLQHTWSLAIEAQFYAVWPIVVTLVARRLHHDWVRRTAIAGAIASWMALLWVGNSAGSAVDGGHIYFGTDTHSSGLFLGAALAVAWIPQNLKWYVSDAAERFINGVGIASLLVLVWAFFNVNEMTGDFYTQGFIIAGVATTLLVATLVHPSSWLAKPLSHPVVQWIGTRSYGLYLWHWVIIQVLRPGRDLSLGTPAVYVLQIALMVAITEFSYRFIEMPIRRGVIKRWLWNIQHQSVRAKRYIAAGAAIAVTVPMLSAVTISANAVASNPNPDSAAGLIVQLDPANTPVKVLAPAISIPRPSASSTAPAKNRKVYVFGDSVVLSAKNGFQKGFDLAGFDAKVGRQAPDLRTVIREYAAKSAGDHDVIFDIGVNGTLQPKHLRVILQFLKHVPRVVIINTSVPRVWQDNNNALIAEWAAKYPKSVRVADWLTASAGHPEYFVKDGIHLTQKGVKAYIACVQKAYASFDE